MTITSKKSLFNLAFFEKSPPFKQHRYTTNRYHFLLQPINTTTHSLWYIFIPETVCLSPCLLSQTGLLARP